LRNLLAEDVRLDMVNRRVLTGRQDVSTYFGRYAEIADWRISPCLAEGRPALLVGNRSDVPGVGYVVLLDWKEGRIAEIRDFRFAAYVMESVRVSRL
jgi:RNA polymerase sigma-70 factor (ECF subfamily)